MIDATARDKDRVMSVLTSKCPNEVENVIVNYFAECLPTFKGTLDELAIIAEKIFEGYSIEKPELWDMCSSLLKSFGRDKLDDDQAEVFPVPISIKDLYASQYNKKNKAAAACIPTQYLYGKAEDNRRRSNVAAAKKREASVSSPSNFFFDCSKKDHVVVRDFRIEPIDVSIGSHTLIQDSSLNIVYGRRYGFVGRNGSGKSTLFGCISQRELKIPSSLSILHVEQEVVANDTPVIQSLLKSDQLRERLLHEANVIQMQLNRPQDLDSHTLSNLDRELQSIYNQLSEIGSDEAPAKASRLLSGLGFTQEMQQKPTKSFSGGWRMRVALARALFCEPDLLLLDEPTNMLDLRSVIWLENYLLKWKKTLITVSHDRSFLANVTTDIIHLVDKKLKQYSCSYENFLETLSQEFKHLTSAKQTQDTQRLNMQKFIDKFRYNSKRASLVQSRIKLIKKIDPIQQPTQDVTVVFKFPACDILPSPIIQLQNVSFKYGSGPFVLENVNFSIDNNSRIGIVGSNGAGKTTLVNLIYGECVASHGSVYRHGKLSQALFSQHHIDSLNLEANSIEFLKSLFPGKSFHFYISSLAKFGIDIKLAKQKIETLSGGQKSRVVFACMAIQNPHFMVLDEPVNHLDLDSVDALTKALNEYNGAYVIVSHDERLITHCCDEMWIVENGKLTKWNGEYSEYRQLILKSIDV